MKLSNLPEPDCNKEIFYVVDEAASQAVLVSCSNRAAVAGASHISNKEGRTLQVVQFIPKGWKLLSGTGLIVPTEAVAVVLKTIAPQEDPNAV